MEKDDVQLIQRILTGDESAFSALVNKYQKSVHALAWRKIGDFHIAEEITQDTFLQVYKKLPTLKDHNQFAGWLYVIANRRCIAWLRKKRLRMQSLESISEDILEKTAYASYLAEQREKASDERRREIVDSLLEKLPDTERTTMILHYLGEMSCKAISKYLGVSLNTVKSRLSRARNRLKQEELIYLDTPDQRQGEDSMENQNRSIPVPVGSLKGDVTTWALPDGAIARLGRGWVPDITFSPDERYLAVGTWMGLWLYDLETLSPIALWETERGMVGRVTFSPHGKWIAVSNSDNILKVLDSKNGGCLTQVETDDYISGLTFSLDNRYFAAAYAGSSTVGIWHAKTGEPFAKFTANVEKARFTRPICFSPDTQLIASSCIIDTTHNTDAIVVWNVKSGQQIALLASHTKEITTICFSPCGQFLVSGGEDGAVYVWDVNTWQQVQSDTDFGDVSRIFPSYSSEGILYAAIVTYEDTAPSTISVCNLESGEQLWTQQISLTTEDYSYFNYWGKTITFLNGSQLAYECKHNFINIRTFAKPDTRQLLHSPISYPTSIMFSEDGKTLAAEHYHEGVVLWDVESRRSQPAIKDPSAGKNQFVYAPINGKFHVATINKNNVSLWSIDGDTRLVAEGMQHDYKSRCPLLTPTGNRLVCALEDGTLIVWDVQSGEKFRELTHPLYVDEDEDDEDNPDEIEQLKLSPDGRFLASESRFTSVRLWDLQTGKEVGTFPSDIYSIIGFSPCGSYLACLGEYIQLWDIASGEMFKTSIKQDLVTDEFAFSPCGQYLAAGMDEIFLWDIVRGELYRQLPLPQGCQEMFPLTFSSCGSYFAAGAWWQPGVEKVPICLWEVETGKHLTTFWGHPTDVQALAFSPDNKLLASGSHDGTILLWDLTPYL